MNRGDILPRGSIGALAIAALMLAATAAAAKTTGVADDPAVQSGPCYEALVDKNAATPTTAPNRELGSACEAEHGDVDKAWARVIRLWGSDSTDVPDYDSYRPADAPVNGAPPRWLAWVGMVIVYVVLGTPMRSAARLMGSSPGPASAAGIDLVLCLALRASIALGVVALLGLPYLPLLLGVALIAWLLARRWIAPRPSMSPPEEGVAGAFATHLAELINDGLGAAPGLVALALIAQHDVAVLAAGLVVALMASSGPGIAGRRALRANRLGAALGPALLAGIIGEILILTPPVVAWAGGLTGATIVVPLILAALTLAADWQGTLSPLRPAQ